jgi:hypothetical protein
MVEILRLIGYFPLAWSGEAVAMVDETGEETTYVVDPTTVPTGTESPASLGFVTVSSVARRDDVVGLKISSWVSPAVL